MSNRTVEWCPPCEEYHAAGEHAADGGHRRAYAGSGPDEGTDWGAYCPACSADIRQYVWPCKTEASDASTSSDLPSSTGTKGEQSTSPAQQITQQPMHGSTPSPTSESVNP